MGTESEMQETIDALRAECEHYRTVNEDLADDCARLSETLHAIAENSDEGETVRRAYNTLLRTTTGGAYLTQHGVPGA